MNRNNTTINPAEFSGKEQEECTRCSLYVYTPEEIEENMCNDCIDELEALDENTNFKNL